LHIARRRRRWQNNYIHGFYKIGISTHSHKPSGQGWSRWGEHENNHHEFYKTMELHNVTMGGA
jgi:hypothetical protein